MELKVEQGKDSPKKEVLEVVRDSQPTMCRIITTSKSKELWLPIRARKSTGTQTTHGASTTQLIVPFTAETLKGMQDIGGNDTEMTFI